MKMKISENALQAINNNNNSSSSELYALQIVNRNSQQLNEINNNGVIVQNGQFTVNGVTGEDASLAQTNGVNSTQNNVTQIPQYCGICGDRATGKHYGALSCDGCKGFFRRSVRRKIKYQCQQKNSCVIDKDKRNQCRHCRLKKCIRAGMKKEAVQSQRDKINPRRSSYDDNSAGVPLRTLTAAEMCSRQCSRYSCGFRIPPGTLRAATLDEICNSMKQQLLSLVDWAKCIPSFTELHIDDQVALLRAHGAEQLLFGLAYRSMDLTDGLILANDYVIFRNSPSEEIRRVGIRIMDELVTVLRELHLDETEFVCLKAIIFFDPCARELVNTSKVKSLRNAIQTSLLDYIEDHQYYARGRFGELLLLLPALQSIALQMVAEIQNAEMDGSARIDSLLQEMLLGGTPAVSVCPRMNCVPADERKGELVLPNMTDNLIRARNGGNETDESEEVYARFE